ncbi:MAG: hypothetical protein SAJ12_10440 [Jaaginema sp. PMC 1079.18]|nr:hypothetical protein [Jaaginema sp. PMC 1080.18]MEC4851419.1 hypothetical protein [Jaaginema sp. PMC 1079.18]MEC4866197.1 hypothetical protein [Jaaginema sp. PMC 1078.18]
MAQQLSTLRRKWRNMLYFLSSLIVVWGWGWLATPTPAQISQAVVQEILDSDRVYIEEIVAEVDAIAEFQQKVRTEDARTSLAFSNGAIARLGPNSEVTIGQCIEVKEGLLLASGPANGCTANFQIGVEGTIYVLEVAEDGISQVKVLEGELAVVGDSEDVPVTLSQGNRLDINPTGEISPPTPLSQEDIETILTGVLFDGFQLELPGMAELQNVLRNLYPDINLPRLPGFDLPIPRPSFPGLPF